MPPGRGLGNSRDFCSFTESRVVVDGLGESPPFALPWRLRRKTTSLWHKGESVVQNTSFVQTQTIIHALEFAISKGGFGRNQQQKRTAAALVKSMKSNKSVSGRHQQLVTLLKKGVTLEGMMKAASASRRTIFRYLNHFEDAGFDIVIDNGRYRLK